MELNKTNISNQINIIRGFDKFLLYLLFIVLSFAAVLHKLFPIMIIEASLFNILIPYSITVFIFMKNIHKMNNNDIIQILLSLAAGLIIILTRTIFYEERLYSLIQSDVYIFFIPVTFIIFKNITISKRELKLFRNIILFVLCVNLINSLLFSINGIFFETVSDTTTGYIDNSRFNGLFGGANISSNVLLIIVLIYLFTSNKFNVIRTLLFSIILLVTILPNLSRGPIFIFFLSLAIYLFINLKSKSINIFYIILFILLLLILGSYIITSIYFTNTFESFSERTEELDGEEGRLNRFLFTVNLMYENFSTFFIGIKGKNQLKSELFTISDNSLTLLLANLGIFFTIYFINLISKFINTFKSIEKNKLIYTIAIITISLINNSLLWTVWVFIAILGYKLISTSEELNKIY